MKTLFIGDLHLAANRPDITQAFCQFLQNISADTQALYIIGDLFEVWVGDDLAEPFTLDIAKQLKKVSLKIPIYYTHGNRDFMLGKDYAALCGMTILPEVYVTDLYGKQTVILHGDSLCTLDKKYQQFRKFRSIRLFRWLYSKLPQSKRLNIADKIKQSSKTQKQQKNSIIMDVENSAVTSLFKQTNCSQMIHGHTHRPNIHNLANHSQRLVVGDWYEQGSILTVTPDGATLTQLPFCD